MNKNFKQLLKSVRCFVFDIDGVLTDGSLIVMPDELIRTMNIRDGYGMHEAILAGYKVIIISGGKSESVRTRLQKLGISEIHLGIENKKPLLQSLLTQHQLSAAEVLYMGDDLPDYEAMQLAGVACCPHDAATEIRELAVYVSPLNGGAGCARDVIEQVMRLQGKWPKPGQP